MDYVVFKQSRRNRSFSLNGFLIQDLWGFFWFSWSSCPCVCF